MAAESHVAEVCAVLSLLVRAMVDKPDEVAITPHPQGESVVIHIKVASGDRGKMIGMGGRTARSLRIILATISKAQGQQYMLDVYGESGPSIPPTLNQKLSIA
jgi:predicted RNA-binding protein YlqC (UPF0109 family)